MKETNRSIHRGVVLTMITVCLLALPLFGAAATQGDSDISDEKLEAVARAYIEVFKINKSYEPRIEAAGSTEEANQLKEAANQAMMDVIEEAEDVTVQEYNDVIGALREDDALRERLQAQVDEIQKEQLEND